MGRYVTNALTESEYKDIIDCIRNGYLGHRPNEQVAVILTLEANLGCRIGDIINLSTDSFVKDGGYWKLNITEEKTGKKRSFIVPEPVKDFVDKWVKSQGIGNHENLFTLTSQAVWKALRQVTDYLGLENVSTHSFRKFVANNLYENTGHDIQAVSQFLQHADTKTTSRYIRRSNAQMEEAILSAVSIV